MPSRIKTWIKEEAKRRGFALAGVAPTHGWGTSEHLEAWLAEGQHATMEWLAKDPARRTDVRRRFPWARSVLMLGMVYRTEDLQAVSSFRRPISGYAWGEDYHDLIGQRLKELGQAIAVEVEGAQAWYYVDTGPLLERAAAAAAGLGWLAKNTMLIDEREGSYLFLGALILSLDLEVDRAAPGRCGSCTRCLEACPTRAFRAPYLLDSARCISYLTIEHRGPIPLELREGMGELIYGCDICQEVCPWNEQAERRELPPGLDEFRARPGLARSDLGLLLSVVSMDQATFSKRFRKSPIKRAKRRGLARNAAIALGNRGDPLAIPGLARAATAHD
ncbi:MAG: tRNA epoxyqueuosine(34) reductase QueG, partial [Planctomycetota bacterium]